MESVGLLKTATRMRPFVSMISSRAPMGFAIFLLARLHLRLGRSHMERFPNCRMHHGRRSINRQTSVASANSAE
jgi:hypothetical protein